MNGFPQRFFHIAKNAEFGKLVVGFGNMSG
jgi:hypothetical protein